MGEIIDNQNTHSVKQVKNTIPRIQCRKLIFQHEIQSKIYTPWINWNMYNGNYKIQKSINELKRQNSILKMNLGTQKHYSGYCWNQARVMVIVNENPGVMAWIV
jgi:hypothetical protein